MLGWMVVWVLIHYQCLYWYWEWARIVCISTRTSWGLGDRTRASVKVGCERFMSVSISALWPGFIHGHSTGDEAEGFGDTRRNFLHIMHPLYKIHITWFNSTNKIFCEFATPAGKKLSGNGHQYLYWEGEGSCACVDEQGGRACLCAHG